MSIKKAVKTLIGCIVLAVTVAVLAIPRGGSGSTIDKWDVYSEDFVLGVVPFSPAQPYAEASGAQVEYFDDFYAACHALAAGKIDGLADDAELAERYADMNPTISLLNDNFGVTSYCGVLRKEDSWLCGHLNRYIPTASNARNGSISEMQKRWLGDEEPVMPRIDPPEQPVGVLRIITSATIEPYSYIGKGGELMGLEIELGMRMAKSVGMDWEFVVAESWAMLNNLMSGKGDIILSGINISDEALDDIIFTNPYHKTRTAVLVQSARAPGVGNVERLSVWQRLKENFTGTFIVQDRWKMIAQGIGVTLLISLSSFAAANVIGDRLCVAKHSGDRLRSRMASGFIRFINGVPVVVLLMLLYYVIFRNIDLPAVIVAVIAFSLSCGAELEAVFEYGLRSVSSGQLEAAESIGFTSKQTFRYIVFPQAAQRIFALYKSTLTSLIKSTSVVGYIAVLDITKISDLIRSRTYAPFFPLLCTTAIYFILTQLVVLALRRVELRFDIERKPRTVKGVTHR